MITIKKHDKEILQATIDSEKSVIEQLKKAYEQALKDINDQLAGLMSRADSDRQYVVYQKEYQKALQAQISGILDQLNAKEFDSVADYLNECYKDGFISVLYSLNKQGIPLIMPIDQQRVVQAVQLDSKISKGLYTRLGEDIKSLKKTISQQISRGLAGGMSYGEIARNIANSSRAGYNNAIRISRTEGSRIQNTAAMDAARKSKELGCDTKKQWLATLDGDTRKSHAQVDGEIKDLDEPFSNGLMYPGDPDGRAAEVVNCRCALAEVASWTLDEKELERLQRNAEFFGLDKSDSFEDFKKKYLQIAPEEYNKINNGLQKFTYKEAVDIAEAEHFAKQLGITADYSKFDISVANEVNKSLTNFYRDYGDLHALGVLDEVKIYPKRLDAVACYVPSLKWACFKNVKAKNALKNMFTNAQENYTLGFWTSGDAVHAINHEFGHAVGAIVKKDIRKYNNIEIIYKKAYHELYGNEIWANAIREGETYEDYLSRCLKAKEAGFSYYGFRNASEFIAEAISGYYGGNESALIKSVIDIIKG